jgi:hypothetical protein
MHYSRPIFRIFAPLSEILQTQWKGVSKLGRGKSFEHKKKSHPGNLPQNSMTEKHSKERIGDEELLVVREAFKNRVGGEENT